MIIPNIITESIPQ